jgi:hypothetical protein
VNFHVWDFYSRCSTLKGTCDFIRWLAGSQTSVRRNLATE